MPTAPLINFGVVGFITKIMKQILLFYFITLIFTSCTSNPKKKKVSLEPISSVNFPVDKRTSFKSRYIKPYRNNSGQEFLIFLSENKPSIKFFDLKNQSLVKEIFLQKEGPDGVGERITGLLVTSMDSIFVFSPYQYSISLVNGKGKLLRRYSLIDSKGINKNTGMAIAYSFSAPTKIGNEIFVNISPDRSIFSSDIMNAKINLKLNIVTGEFEYFNQWPQYFQNKIWSYFCMLFASEYANNQFIYSYRMADSLYTLAPGSRKKKAFFAKTKFNLNSVSPFLGARTDSNDKKQSYFFNNTCYGAILYDEYRNIYYRLVRHAIPYKSKDGQINEFHRRPISIMVFDEKFQVLGETLLEKDKYYSNMSFVTKDGLYISNANPYNNEINEDYSTFTLFKLED